MLFTAPVLDIHLYQRLAGITRSDSHAEGRRLQGPAEALTSECDTIPAAWPNGYTALYPATPFNQGERPRLYCTLFLQTCSFTDFSRTQQPRQKQICPSSAEWWICITCAVISCVNVIELDTCVLLTGSSGSASWL